MFDAFNEAYMFFFLLSVWMSVSRLLIKYTWKPMLCVMGIDEFEIIICQKLKCKIHISMDSRLYEIMYIFFMAE